MNRHGGGGLSPHHLIEGMCCRIKLPDVLPYKVQH